MGLSTVGHRSVSGSTMIPIHIRQARCLAICVRSKLDRIYPRSTRWFSPPSFHAWHSTTLPLGQHRGAWHPALESGTAYSQAGFAPDDPWTRDMYFRWAALSSAHLGSPVAQPRAGELAVSCRSLGTSPRQSSLVTGRTAQTPSNLSSLLGVDVGSGATSGRARAMTHARPRRAPLDSPRSPRGAWVESSRNVRPGRITPDRCILRIVTNPLRL